jgi:predicted nucleic acid-binding Zn ribbon protein
MPDEIDDRELPDESDMDDSDEPDLVQCPYCKKYISEDAERCHHCGKYISVEDGRSPRRNWMITGIVLTLLVITVWIFIFRNR